MSQREPLPQRVYRLLSDGQMHSGTRLAADCRVSRNAIWKSIAALRSLGVSVHAVPNRGYRVPAATGLLEREHIVRLLPRTVAASLRTGQCVWRTGSTNSDLLLRQPLPPGFLARFGDAFFAVAETAVPLELAVAQLFLPVVRRALEARKASAGLYDFDDMLRLQ